MTISAFIPTYNYARFLPRAIESLLAQTLSPLEIIVADDGSTDNTAEVVAKYGSKVNYQRFDHMGVYGIRNEMLKRVKGEWFFNLDADNWAEPEFLERAADMLSREDDVKLAFVYPDSITFGDYTRQNKAPEFSLERFKEGNYVDMNSLVKTSVARKFGFDPAFNDGWGDYDFFLTLAKNGYTGRRMPGSPLHYRMHGASITAETREYDRKQRLMRRITEKHTDFFTEREAARAIRKFRPAAVMRHRLSELWWAGRYWEALRFAGRLFLPHGDTLTKTVIML